MFMLYDIAWVVLIWIRAFGDASSLISSSACASFLKYKPAIGCLQQNPNTMNKTAQFISGLLIFGFITIFVVFFFYKLTAERLLKRDLEITRILDKTCNT